MHVLLPNYNKHVHHSNPKAYAGLQQEPAKSSKRSISCGLRYDRGEDGQGQRNKLTGCPCEVTVLRKVSYEDASNNAKPRA